MRSQEPGARESPAQMCQEDAQGVCLVNCSPVIIEKVWRVHAWRSEGSRPSREVTLFRGVLHNHSRLYLLPLF